ncbi:hypothetical protein KIMH_04200 [Bombiscardovia apis]|uniref:Abi-like protein n=1 Tax=Bombiscardovia apis TaxID=2932182 RepID=A0ABM8BBV4_9BIFI|nr:hypothetical protein [Bombiscardovia apis]BDR54309.1 hypothetical protein KIMH_04200 [Bombiscardovia apis]
MTSEESHGFTPIQPDPSANYAELLFSAARFKRYLKSTDGDYQKAISLCKWNQDFAGLLQAQIGYVEIAIRNTIDRELRHLCAQNLKNPNWCLPGQAPQLVNALIRGNLLNARQLALEDARKWKEPHHHRVDLTVNHDDILAHLMWGSWVKLIGEATTSEKTAKQQILWTIALYRAFPNVEPTEKGRMYIAKNMNYVRRVRNRAAHFDNLFEEAYKINSIIGALMSLLSSIETGLTHGWIDTITLRRSARTFKTLEASS